jgi:hypothetical protein
MNMTIDERALAAIRRQSKNGFPTIDSLKAELGVRSTGKIQMALASLREKGLLVKWPGRRQPMILLAPKALKTAA